MSGTLTVDLSGTATAIPPEISLSETTVDVGSRLVSTTGSSTVVITCVEDIVWTAVLSGADADQFALVGAHSSVSLTKGQTSTLQVAHAPTAAGVHAARIAIQDADGVERGAITLSATGVATDEPTVANDATTLALGTHFVGTTATGSVTLLTADNGDTYTVTPSVASTNALTIDLATAQTLTGGTSLVVTVTYCMRRPRPGPTATPSPSRGPGAAPTPPAER